LLTFPPQRDKANKIENEIKLQLQRLFQEQQGPQAPRQSYQVHVSRTAVQGLAGVVNNTVILDNPLTRSVGPVVVLAKNTLSFPKDDSFDGDLNGFLDVNEALLAWNSSNLAAPNIVDENDFRVSVVEGLERFTNKLRSRATVNGGSIGLRALVVSGVTNAVGGVITFQKLRRRTAFSSPRASPSLMQENSATTSRSTPAPIGNGGVARPHRSRSLKFRRRCRSPTFLDGTALPRPTVADPSDLTASDLTPGGPRRRRPRFRPPAVSLKGRFSFEKCSAVQLLQLMWSLKLNVFILLRGRTNKTNLGALANHSASLNELAREGRPIPRLLLGPVN
jgi:hypothetical protein